MTTAPYIYEDNLETARLRTRFLTIDDVEAWKVFFSDKDAIEFFPSFGITNAEEQPKGWIQRQLDRYASKRYGLQALIDKKTGAFIGQCGLLMQEVDGEKELEVGYHVFRQYWGSGYAPEAARMFIDYGFRNNQAESIVSIIHVNNIRSQRVADKNGLKRGKKTTWSDIDVYIYRVHKEDWK